MSGTDVGSIVGYLRLDGSQFRDEIAAAIAELKVLSGTNVNIDVKTDKLREVEADSAAAVRGLENVDREVTKVGNNGRQSTGMLLTSLLLLGPALIPIAAGAAGLGLAFGGMATAGIAAFMGIKDEMAQGTNVGIAYSRGIATVEDALRRLADLAATNVLGSFQTTVSDLISKMPALSSEVGNLATMTGKAASAVVGGLLNAFVSLAPYIEQAATQVVNLAQGFQGFTAGTGFQKLAAYLVAELPQVISFVSNLLVLVGHLVEALLPFGSGILSAVEVFIQAIDSIPVSMLTQLAQLALSVFAGFKTWEAITGIVEGTVEALKALNVTLEISEGVLRNLDIAASVIGVAIAAFSLILAHNASVSEEAKAKQEAYADAVRASKGAIDEEVRSVAAKQLEEEGALSTAQQLGISMSDVTSATLGQKAALDKVIPALDQMIRVGTKTTYSTYGTTTSMNDQAKAASKLKESILGQSDALQSQIRTQQAVNAASAVTRANMTDEEKKTEALAAAYHMSVAAFQSATKAQQSDAASLAATTAKMQLESDAAGLLKDALDRLNGKAITAAEAQQQFDQSLVSMTKAQNAAGKSVHITKNNIDDQTAASVQVRGSLIQQVNALQRVVEANGGLSNSTGAARAQMMHMRQEIINNAVAHGVDRAAVTAYIDKLLKIPRSVPPTKLQVDNARALAAIRAVKGGLGSIPRNISVAITTRAANIAATIASIKGNRYGGIEHFRQGGIESFMGGGFRQTAFQSFADGKLPNQAMIAPDGANLVQWAEHGTGGEAFIPLGSANHARSVAIWEETGRRLGVSAGAQSLTGIEISGTLQTPWGPSEIRGVVKSELKAAATESRVSDRLRSGVNRP
jgi:hypothetical protein